MTPDALGNKVATVARRMPLGRPKVQINYRIPLDFKRWLEEYANACRVTLQVLVYLGICFGLDSARGHLEEELLRKKRLGIDEENQVPAKRELVWRTVQVFPETREHIERFATETKVSTADLIEQALISGIRRAIAAFNHAVFPPRPGRYEAFMEKMCSKDLWSTPLRIPGASSASEVAPIPRTGLRRMVPKPPQKNPLLITVKFPDERQKARIKRAVHYHPVVDNMCAWIREAIEEKLARELPEIEKKVPPGSAVPPARGPQFIPV